ncbi:MAG: glycosyltransferase family A protein [Anaerolineales bacterium]
MSDNNPRCSVVVRAFNEEKHIGRLLTGIMHQTIKEVEIVLVDSGSSDATVAIAARYPVKIVHIRPEEFTFGRSLNRGIEQTTSESVVIASAHVYPVFPDWLERLLEPFDNPRVALVYGKQRGNESSYYSEQQHFAKLFPAERIAVQKHPFCNNANAAIRRTLWQQHPYDESLSGLEDLEWANWALGEGHHIAYIAEAEIIHVHDETPQGVYNRYRREAMAFKRIFPQETFSLSDFFRLLVTNISSDIWHAARQGKLGSSLGGILWFRWNQFWGTYQGYRQAGPLTWQLRKTFYYPNGLRASADDPTRNVEPIQYQDIVEKS